MNTRRRFLLQASASLALPVSALSQVAESATSELPAAGLRITSVSWIDGAGLPQLELFSQKSLAAYWPAKVAAGLTATRNPRPADPLPANFSGQGQFRALIDYRIKSDRSVADARLDPGTTPAASSENIKGWNNIPFVLGLYSDTGPHAGQKSAISAVHGRRLHPNSSLSIPKDAEVIASALIKFRAGIETNDAGVKKAGSPYHVPWVWSEHAIVRQTGQLRLFANGSQFPSHAWYVNGKRIAQLIQAPVTISDTEPAFTTGAPVKDPVTGDDVPFDDPNADESQGPVTRHAYTVQASNDEQLSVAVTL